MTQAFYTAISGINANQSQLVVVSDNIANMNTTAFKSSRVTFSDVYYTTLSAGSPPTKEVGGTNPKQVGAGVKVASIDRDMTSGTVTSTGITTDCNIQGNGFFVVQSSSGEPLYTRAGNFTIDSNGYLTLPNGYRVIGAVNEFGTTTSGIPLQIPQMISTETLPNDTDKMIGKNFSDLNTCEIQNGNFYVNVKVEGAIEPVEVCVDLDASVTNLSEVKTAIESAFADAKITNLSVDFAGGKMNLKVTDGESEKKAVALDFTNAKQGTSNFLSTTELRPNDTEYKDFSTKILDYKQVINAPQTVELAQKYSSLSITENGILEITYSNGDKLSVYEDEFKRNQFKYTTSEGIIIKGDSSDTTDVKVASSVLQAPNLQIQLAQFMNPNGLKAVGNNLFQVGPNAGTTYYGVGNSNAFGSIQTGGLEASNVDISTEFASMITAQRAVEANSRIFDTANQIMKTLVYLGS